MSTGILAAQNAGRRLCSTRPKSLRSLSSTLYPFSASDGLPVIWFDPYDFIQICDGELAVILVLQKDCA